MYGGQATLTRLVEIINRVWRGEGFPNSWREGIITPIFKKGDRDKLENYKGITLLNTAYKIYAMVLQNRLEKEIEEKKMLPKTQAGFRRGRSTIDNIFILNYIANREIKRAGDKLYTFFADLSAAFDKWIEIN